MSTRALSKRPLLIVGGILLVLAVVGLWPRGAAPTPTNSAPVLTVREGEAGKAGEIQVTQEALKLAEITIEPAATRLVAEQLAVSGVVRAEGDQLVKVTPRVAGKVVRLLANVGDEVRPRQPLAVLESLELAQAQSAYRQAASRVSALEENLKRQRELARLGQFGGPQVEGARSSSFGAEREVQDAERRLVDERTSLAEAQADQRALASRLEQAQAEAGVIKARLDRAEALFKEELISRQELERIQADHQKAAADVRVSEAAVSQGAARTQGAAARLEASEKDLALAQSRAALARQGLQREEKVFEGQYLTSREIVQAEAELRGARVALEGARDAVSLLGGSPGGGNTFALSSPISGRVESRTLTLGETIDPEHAAFTVVNLDQVWVELGIRPADLASVRIGDRVRLTSEAAPDRAFSGVVLSIGATADEQTRTVAVRTTLGNSSHLLKPGAMVQGYVVTDVRRERVTVPQASLQEHAGRPTLYVSLPKEGAFEIRHVKLGVAGDGWREVAEGLRPGERIAASGTFYLKSEALKDSLSDGCCAPGT